MTRVRGHLSSPTGDRWTDVLSVQSDPNTVQVWGRNGVNEGQQHPRHRRFVLMFTVPGTLTKHGGIDRRATITESDGSVWEIAGLKECCGAWTRGFTP